jgi:hypothetical protein
MECPEDKPLQWIGLYQFEPHSSFPSREACTALDAWEARARNDKKSKQVNAFGRRDNGQGFEGSHETMRKRCYWFGLDSSCAFGGNSQSTATTPMSASDA